MVKKLSSDKSYVKTAGLFQYFLTFSQKTCVCIIDIGKLIEIWNLVMPHPLKCVLDVFKLLEPATHEMNS